MPMTSQSQSPWANAVSSNNDRWVHKEETARGSPTWICLLPFLLAVQRVKAESAKAAEKMLEEMQKKNQQMMEEKEKSYQEYEKQLTEKMEQERAQLMAEQERALALKLEVYNDFILRFLFFSCCPLFLAYLSVRTWNLERPCIPIYNFQSLSVCLAWNLPTIFFNV